MNFEYLEVEKKEKFALVKINRPKALNALNTDVLSDLKNAFTELENDKNVRAIILTGKGKKSFVAGADISEMKDQDVIQAKKFAETGHEAFNAIDKNTKPVIAAINGFCLGGGNELAMACDIRIASENAKFGQPEVGLGIIPGFGGTQRLGKIVGESWAKELILTGNNIDVKKAERIGLVNEVVSQDELLGKAFEKAEDIANQAPLAVQMAKEAINFGREEGIESGLSFETNAFSYCFCTDDQKNGMEAFMNKKSVEFEGK